MATGSLMNEESTVEYFDLHLAIIGLENQFSVFLREVVLHRFYCISLLLDLKCLIGQLFLKFCPG